MANVTATTGIDNFNGTGSGTTSGTDEILVTNQNQIQSGDLFDGGGGTDTLRLGTSIDFSSIVNSSTSGIKNIEILRYNGAFTATFRSDQFGAGLLSPSLQLRGAGGVQNIVINMIAGGSTFNMGNWTFNNWTNGTDLITVNGSSGNDTAIFSSQNTIFDGAAGIDTIDHSMWSGTVTVTLDGSNWVNANWASGIVDTIRNVENFFGASGNDSITGDSLDNSLGGAGGNDTLTGGAGNDTLDGGDGTDTLNGGIGDDILIGGLLADSMTGGTGNDTFYVDNAGDVVIDRASDTGTDTVFSSVTFSAAGTQQDGIENITLTGTGAINATGNALNNVLTGNSGNNTLDGGDGNDQLYGNDGLDTLTGGIGDDVLDGGTGGDTMTGGAGGDTYSVDNLSDVVDEFSSDTGTDLVVSTVTFSAAGTNQSGIENITLTGSSNINATGNSLVNSLTGNSGNNVLDGGTGADTMTGGAGSDTYYVDDAGDIVVDLSSNAGTDLVFSSVTFSAAGTNQSGIENITLTGSSAINATGNDLANLLTGNGAANTLNGGLGNDTLIGGLGNDTLTGGTGADTFRIDVYDATTGQFDTITDFSIADGDKIDLGTNGPASFEVLSRHFIRADGLGNARIEGVWGDNGQVLTLNGVARSSLTADQFIFDTSGTVRNLTGTSGADSLFGGLGNDTINGGNGTGFLCGDAGDDTITGGNDADVIDGGQGVDTMTGGNGNDIYYVDNVGDIVSESSLTGGRDLVYSWVSYSLTGTSSAVELGRLVGTSNVDMTGNDLANTLIGNTGNNTLSGGLGGDVLNGGNGNDTLVGGQGNDDLTGGNGADVFVFNVGDGADTVRDFSVAQDQLDLRALGIDSASELVPHASNSGANLVLNFGSGNTVTLQNVQVAQIHDGMFVV